MSTEIFKTDQEFIIPIRCENEKRVRVDYFGSLEDLDVFQIEIVNNDGVNITYNLVSDKPLRDWVISYS